jgi:hypothetical protein
MMRSHQVALWAGVVAFFGSLLAIGIFDVLNAGGVYSKQRLDDEKKARVLGGKIIVNDVGDKKIFSLELDEDPEVLEQGTRLSSRSRRGKGG